MRVLQVFGKMNMGGAESFIMEIYRKIDKRKIQFDFVVHSPKKGYFEDEIKRLGGQIYRIPQYKIYNHFKYKKAWDKLFLKSKYKVLHSHVRSTAKIFLKIAKKHKITTILHSHSTTNGKGFSALYKKLLKINSAKNADYKFSCSIKAGKWLFGGEIEENPNFYVIKNSIDTSKFKFNQEKKNIMKKKLGIEGKKVIGHVGRFIKLKNHHRILSIFSDYQKGNPDTALILVGKGKQFRKIKSAVEFKKIPNVYLLGSRSDVNDVMQTFDVFLFPSFKEGFPVTLIEAQSMGIPCVISDTITEEVKITDIVEFVSLNKKNSDWVREIEKFMCKTKKDYNKIVKTEGYSSKEVALFLKEFYLKHS